MTTKRFIFEQNGNFHTVRDTVENKPMGVFEFRDNEFPVYACFHRIIDLMNDLSDENEQLKKSVKRQQGSNNECAKLIEEQQKENEQLKEEIETLQEELAHFLGDV